MTVQITIIGLGQIGASIGLALAEHSDKITRTGSDIDPKTASQAKNQGAVDKTVINLGAAVRNADLVLLAIPMDQIREMIAAIGPELKSGAVLMDTAPLKGVVVGWADDHLPEGRSYVGLTPILNPKYLHNETYGLNAARADLFHEGLLAITSAIGASPKAIDLAADLAALLGAAPFFIDLYEIDGLMASTHITPQLLSTALLNATLDQPGWAEARKVAGRAFAEVTGPAAHLDDAAALSAAALANRDNVVRTLDNAIAALQSIRQDIDQADAAGLEKRIRHAKAGVNQWWRERGGGNWLAEEIPKNENVPTSRDIMGGLIGFGLGRKKKRE